MATETKKKKYEKPKVKTSELYERESLACVKVNQTNPAVCNVTPTFS